jgi:hypothetical protein
MADVKTLTHPTSGQTFKLGRNRPQVIPPHLRLGNYMLRKMPEPPSSISYGTGSGVPSWLANILGNDNNGDCTIAAAFHIGGMLMLNAGCPFPPAYDATSAVRLYYQLTGGEDTGLDEQTVFNWWQAHGLLSNGTHEIKARVFVDPTDIEQIQTAIWLFENLYLTAALPDGWISPMPSASGFTWGVVGDPNPDNGHAFMSFGYGSSGVQIDTWGLLGTLMYPAIGKYNNQTAGGGCYAIVSQDTINKGTNRAPSGFDWTQLSADIAAFHS